MNPLRNLLAHPLTRDLALDDPKTTVLRKEILNQKAFLRRIYQDWYCQILEKLPESHELVLELGSGPGFLKENLPDAITSEIFWEPEVDIVLNGLNLPFSPFSLSAILMTDVLHHIGDPRRFFNEASRCIPPLGRIIMVEPWVSQWSSLVYTYLHHEPFNPDAATWEFQQTGPISGANIALPWMIFRRDKTVFEEEFPQWRIEKIFPMMPFVYLLSGGVSLRSLIPGWTYSFWRWIERRFDKSIDKMAMFALIVLQKR